MALPCGTTGSLQPISSLLDLLVSQSSSLLFTLFNDFQPFWGTFGRLRYLRRHERPSTNCPSDCLPPRLVICGLISHNLQGSIPPAPPSKPVFRFHGFLPIPNMHQTLNIKLQVKSMGAFLPSCRVTCIFTGTKISTESLC